MVALLLGLAIVKADPVDLKVSVGGVERRALVFPSSKSSQPNPVVFVFHGFTGTARHAAFSYRMHEAWPEATVVYPQGLEVSLLNRKGPGWQIAPRLQEDRDLKFYDALLGKIKSDYKVDTKRVYTCGMSNGAIFSYVLLSTRGSTLTAAGPVAGFAPPAFDDAAAKPIIIIHGKNDTLIRLAQGERSRDLAVGNNGATKSTREWIAGYEMYTGSKGNDVVWHVHDGGHTWPSGTSEALVKFFKAH